MAKKPDQNKAMRPGEDKLARDQATLERDANLDGEPAVRSDHKTVTCKNRGCADYDRPRTDGSKCECSRGRSVLR